jgi:hypothetical protein
MSSKQNEDIPEIRAAPATSEEKSWIEYQRTESQGTLKRLEETAKYLSGLSSISLTILLGADHELFKSLHNSPLLKAGVISWLLSILFTLAVVFPFRYSYIGNSFSSIRTMHKRIAKLKFAFLILGSILYLTGISLLAYLYLYL